MRFCCVPLPTARYSNTGCKMNPTGRATRLADRAYDYTKSLLFDGKLSPGARVSVEEIVDAVFASRQPVMEALKRLASEGYVEVIPQVGCRVNAPKPAEMLDFFRLYASAEGLTAELAAVRGTQEQHTEMLHAHRDMNMQGDELAEQDPKRWYREKNRAFHERIYRMANSAMVTSQTEALSDRCDFYISTAAAGVPMLTSLIERSYAQHEAVADAILSRDPQRARFAMELHILSFGASIQRLIGI